MESNEGLRDIIGPNGFVGMYRCQRTDTGELSYTRTESWNVVGITDEDQRMIDLCKKWIRMFVTKRGTINRKGPGSYGLKHEVERWAGTYIYNGAFILAALEEGYAYKRDDPNADFNMSFKNHKALCYRCPNCRSRIFNAYVGGHKGPCPRCGALLHRRKEGVIEVVEK